MEIYVHIYIYTRIIISNQRLHSIICPSVSIVSMPRMPEFPHGNRGFGAFLATVMLCLYGYAASEAWICSQKFLQSNASDPREVWHLLILHGAMGIGLGLFVPALGPTLQRYSTLAHPKKVRKHCIPMCLRPGSNGLNSILFRVDSAFPN